MDLSAYLYTVNKNNSFKLDTDEIKDVKSQINIFLLGKSYNNLLQKKTVLSFYFKAVKKKINNENFIQSENYTSIIDTGSYEEIQEKENQRKEKIKNLQLNNIQKRILKYLVEGLSYTETRRKCRLSKNQFFNHIARIKKKKNNAKLPVI